VDVRLITATGMTRHRPDEIEALLDGPGLVWVDAQYWDAETARFLAKRLGLDPHTVHDCAVRNPVPRMRVEDDYTFFVLHAPERDRDGRVHAIEIDQVVGSNWLLSVHGPIDPEVELEATYVETRTVTRRLASGKLRPTAAHELSAALVDVLVGRMRDYLTALTEDVWTLERQVTAGYLGNPEEFLEELFGARHGLMVLRTMATHTSEMYGLMVQEAALGPDATAAGTDLEDQFHRVAAMADGQRGYLEGVIEFYQTRTETKMTIAAERLAVIAAVTLPITALSSILGMNVIVYDTTAVGTLVWILALMLVISAVLLEWTRRRGWW
jgi:Mg2+ and Co2+ transporter CorA